jgi:DNA-binding winged helix-turn-helix (wHTH) protein/tetratricopeptide (TPR) repeat protein
MSSEARETEVYEFGPFRLDAAVRRLEREGAPVTLTAKLFDILLLLVGRRGELVTKGEMIAEVWSDRVVEENNLTVSISALRKALGETNDGRRQYIETVPKYGYRFVAQVRRVTNGGAAPRESAVQPTTAAVRSLAVLPILNAARDAELDYLADGITEGVINRLSALPELRVMARSTVFRFKGSANDPREVGAALGVRAVLVGELRRVGDGLEISAELVDVRDGSQIWGGQYRRRLSGTYALHEEIAREISERLFVKLSPGDGGLGRSDTEDWEAYHLFLKGRYFWAKRDGNIGHYKKAMRYFEAAIALDKGYAQAYVGLADCHTDLVMWDEIPPTEGYPPAKELLQKALAIDDKLADAHASVASVREFFDWDFEGADLSYQRSIGLNPNSALTRRRYATYLSRTGRWRAALEELRLAQLTDPLPGLIDFKIGRILYYGRQYERAVEQCHKTLAINPRIGDPYILIAHALVKLGRMEEAVEAAIRGHALMANSIEALANVGYVHGAAGLRAQAFEVLAELHATTELKYVPHHLTALVYAGLGDADATIDRLEMAFREKSIYMAGLGTLPVFDDLRRDARFQSLLKRIGFPARLCGETPRIDE